MELACALPGCMNPGLEYYTASLSFQQDRVQRYRVDLIFEEECPQWLRVYECAPSGALRLLRDLAPLSVGADRTVYRDLAEDVPARAARIYFFNRDHVIRKAA